jgi:hypothetical protein
MSADACWLLCVAPQQPDSFQQLSPLPVCSPRLQGKHVVCVSVGDWHNAAICQNGQLYMWGRGDCG